MSAQKEERDVIEQQHRHVSQEDNLLDSVEGPRAEAGYLRKAVVGMAPEWMHEKAIAIGIYFVASGVYTMFGVGNPVSGSPEIIKMISEGWEAKVGGKLEFEADWTKMVEKAITHIDAKRKALKLEEYNPTRYAKSASYLPGDVFSPEEYSKGLYSLPHSH